jgi:hypothetical protein
MWVVTLSEGDETDSRLAGVSGLRLGDECRLSNTYQILLALI